MTILQIPEDKLRLLLEKKKQNIGGDNKALAAMSVAITLLITHLTSNYKSYSWITSEQITIVSVFVLSVCFFYSIYRFIFNRYNQNKLLEDIRELSTLKNECRALVVIKDTFSKFPNRFLVYFDEIYHCYLCPHFPISKKEIMSHSYSEKIVGYVSSELHVSKKHLSFISFREQKEHIKYSLRENDNKSFLFYYYKVDISNFDKYPNITKDSFIIQGKLFAWKSVSELRNDTNTMERNNDVVNFLESNEW